MVLPYVSLHRERLHRVISDSSKSENHSFRIKHQTLYTAALWEHHVEPKWQFEWVSVALAAIFQKNNCFRFLLPLKDTIQVWQLVCSGRIPVHWVSLSVHASGFVRGWTWTYAWGHDGDKSPNRKVVGIHFFPWLAVNIDCFSFISYLVFIQIILPIQVFFFTMHSWISLKA